MPAGRLGSDFTNKYLSNLIQSMSEYEGGTFRCTLCAKEFILKADADRHFLEAHSEEKTNVMERDAIFL